MHQFADDGENSALETASVTDKGPCLQEFQDLNLDCRCVVGENLLECADDSGNSDRETAAVTDEGLCLQEILTAGA